MAIASTAQEKYRTIGLWKFVSLDLVHLPKSIILKGHYVHKFEEKERSKLTITTILDPIYREKYGDEELRDKIQRIYREYVARSSSVGRREDLMEMVGECFSLKFLASDAVVIQLSGITSGQTESV